MLRLAAIALVAAAAPAAAEPLTTLWTLEPIAVPPTSVAYGDRFFEQRLLPGRLVRTSGQPAAKLLYLVYTADRRVAWCTFKDRSTGNVAKSLFIPALDKRPCYIDRDDDGRFDASFSVFDKYGSMATPSGNPGEVTPLPAPIAYQRVDPRLAPATMRVAFELGGSSDPARTRVTVAFAKGGGNRWDALVGETPRQGNTLRVLNTALTIRSVSGKLATISLQVDPDVLVTGSSGGVLMPTRRPAFLR